MNNKLLRRMDLICIKRKQKKPLQPEPWCCAGPSQGPARVLLYFDQLTHFQMKAKKGWESLLSSFYKGVLIPAASTLRNVQLSTSPPFGPMPVFIVL